MATRKVATGGYHHGDLRNTLLEVAPRMIDTGGVDAFGLRALAREVGVAHTAIYRHFPDKGALLAALAINGHSALRSSLSAHIDPAQDLQGKIAATGVAYLRWANDHRGLYQVMFGPRLNEEGAYPELETAIESTFQVVDNIFLNAGWSTPADARTLAVTLLTTLHGYCDLKRLKRIRVKSQKAAEAHLLTILQPLMQGIIAPSD